jgi:hypothetical protein
LEATWTGSLEERMGLRESLARGRDEKSRDELALCC